MDFMKVIDQTVREIKREVNLKVLKVPEIEQKVLDATDNEPWGPHGSALVEIAQATKKFSECQMVMNVLWTRLSETGKDWRYVYKALAVIEYLIANGSERAVDDIIEHTFQISSLTSFEYIEPNGKDSGLNVRKKAETIVNLLNNKDKIQESRNKAAANRDKYVGLSSTGISYKSSAPSFGSGSFGSDRYGGYGDTFRDSYKERDQYGEEKDDKDAYDQSTFSASKPATKLNAPEKYGSIPSESTSVPSSNYDDDFDDFDPRGISSNKTAAKSSGQVDLFGVDLLDISSSVASDVPAMSSNSPDIDLFADAAFVSATPSAEAADSSQSQDNIDLFASQPAIVSTFSSPVDLFAAPDPVVQPEIKAPKSDPINSDPVDPFAAVAPNKFDESDLFGAFTSNEDSGSSEVGKKPADNGNPNNLKGNSMSELNSQPKKAKKVNLADVGIVGGLTDGSEEKEKGPSTVNFMGRAMGSGSGLGRSGFASSTSTGTGGDDFFSSLGSQQYQFGNFQK
ncbi:ENTH domain [Dillenia turbinata]|uniref:ENTH domain n=1 Tax=Dillenia turbinata TaxID=194707 RepID=A0AAN8Z9J4_9MAGN